MIISASRRTDIPALYGKWFLNRIREGYCLVPNPHNMNQVSRVSLRPNDVDAIIFWSKNPSPFFPVLPELDKLGFRYYFQFSLNNYPRALEPNIPSIDERISSFKYLSHLIGSVRVIWRYDPIIISDITSIEFHRENFSIIAEKLKDTTYRVMISLVDYYRKTEHRLSQLEHEEEIRFDRSVDYSNAVFYLLKDMANIAAHNGIEVFTCAEQRDFGEAGILPGKCIDNQLLHQIWNVHLTYKKDPYQRKSCLCMISKDIGINDTCIHGCPYCYSTTNYNVAQRRFNEHDPDSPTLWGKYDITQKHIPQFVNKFDLFNNCDNT